MKYLDLNAAVGSTAILGAVGVSGLDGRVCRTCVGQAQGLDKLVPQEQLTVIASRPELAGTDGSCPQAQQVLHPGGIEVRVSAWQRCCLTLPVDRRTLKSHRFCGTSKDTAPRLRLVVTSMAPTH